uniref:5-azacytidine-induced protein 2 n=1 Tax=Latimeria chalumnae TaxID=7897 RepID=H3BCD3_LATCH
MEMFMEDDICILKHEKADCMQRSGKESPVSANESIASHFALVTAYEDIKKRLKETEKENAVLRRRVRALEERIQRTDREEEKNVVGREQVNKAYQAYREICLERDSLKTKLEQTAKEQMELTKVLNEQLQVKEVELLQLKSELETHQVMKNLNQTKASWEMEKVNSDLKVHSLEQELEILKQECSGLRIELQKQKLTLPYQNPLLYHTKLEILTIRSKFLQRAYWELKKEMSNLHLVTKVQSEVLRKLRATLTAANKDSLSFPAQCVEDLEKDLSQLDFTSTGAIYRPAVSTLNSTDKRNSPTAPPFQLDTVALPNEEILQPWTSQRPNPVGSTALHEHSSYGMSSWDDNSWVFPTPPKPSDTLFWEPRSSSSSASNPANHLYHHNQNFLHRN